MLENFILLLSSILIVLIKNNKSGYLLSAFIVGLVFINRDFAADIENDSILYMNEFISIKNGLSISESNLFWKGEIVFLLLFKAFSFLNEILFFYLLISSSIFLLFYSVSDIFNHFNEKKKSIILIPLLLISYEFLLLYGNVIRQGISLSIGLYSISLFLRNRLKTSLILIVIGSMIHTSGLIFLIPLLQKINYKSKRILISAIPLVIVFFSLRFNFLIDYMISKLNIYQNTQFNFLIFKVLYAFSPLILIPFKNFKSESFKFFRVIYFLVLVSIFSPKIFGRLYLVLIPLNSILFSQLFHYSSLINRNIYLIILLNLFVIVFFVLHNTDSVKGLLYF